MKIVPAILTNDLKELNEMLRKIRDAKKFERVQIDFIDGEYAANRTIRPSECDLIPYLPIKFDAQLMVTENNVWEWAKYAEKVGFERIIPQVESISEPEKFDCLAMDMHSPVEVLKPYLKNLKYVLVMSVEPCDPSGNSVVAVGNSRRPECQHSIGRGRTVADEPFGSLACLIERWHHR